MILDKKIALVTGCSKGIGYELCLQLLAQGAIVHGISRSEVNIAHPNFTFYRADVRNYNDVKAISQSILNLHPSIDILINNAGLGYFGFCENLEIEQWHEMMDTNVSAMFYFCKLFLPGMKNQQMGHIVNIASTAGLEGYIQVSGYCATKFAVKGFSDALYKEVREEGIKVTCVYPGSVKTDFFRHNENVHPHDNMLSATELAETIIYTIKTSNNFHPVNLEIRPLIVKPKK